MRGIVIMEKNLAWLAEPRISFESQIRQLKYELALLPLATCFNWSLWHVSVDRLLACSITERILSYLNVAICIPPSQYNNRISHGSSMWNFKFNRRVSKNNSEFSGQVEKTSAQFKSSQLIFLLLMSRTTELAEKSALKCGRLSLSFSIV